MTAGNQMLGGGSSEPWLRAFNDPELRGVRVLDSFEVEVEPWGGELAFYRSAPNGGADGGIVRTKGDPASMRAMMDEHGADLEAAAQHFGLPLSWVAGMAGIEAVRGNGMRWDSRSYRYEPRIHDFSAGIMQTLSQTAEGERRARFPSMSTFKTLGRLAAGEDHPLFHEVGEMLGVAYMQTMVDRYGMHPPMVCSGYNAGAAKRCGPFLVTDKETGQHVRNERWTEFGVKCYGATRPIKMFCWINDFTAVLRERGLVE